MRLYKISQQYNFGYDTYSDAVVAARNEKEARSMHPDGGTKIGDPSYTWVSDPEQVTAELIGTAIKGTEAGVICSSYHAG